LVLPQTGLDTSVFYAPNTKCGGIKICTGPSLLKTYVKKSYVRNSSYINKEIMTKLLHVVDLCV